MSQRTYNKQWASAHSALTRLLTEECPAEPPRPEADVTLFLHRMAMRYVRYIQIFRQLEEVYDQVVHPQKRRAVRATLDGVMGRVMELKNEMADKEFTEYHYMGDALHDLKLTAADLEIPIPRYFMAEQSKELQEQKTMLMNLFKKKAEAVETPAPVRVKTMSIEDAVELLQVAERARQGRLRARVNDKRRKMERVCRSKSSGKADVQKAAVSIQKVWRGYVQRKKAKAAQHEKMIFLGMATDPKHQVPSAAEITAQANAATTRIKQQEYEEDYQKSVEEVTKHLQDVEGVYLKESRKELIRQWFFEVYDATGAFPDYPEAEEGGSTLLFVEKNLQQLMNEIAEKEMAETSINKSAKKEEKEKEKTDKEKDEKEGLTNEEEEGLMMLPSAFLSDLVEASKIYADVWQNRNESSNFSQRHEVELITVEKRAQMQEEIQLQVDEDMRQELVQWKQTADKGGKAKGDKKKKDKNGKKEKKKKGVEEDLTVDRTLESLCEELVEQGLLKEVNAVRMTDYLGDFRYLGTEQRQNDTDPMPSLADVRQVLSVYAILPLGSQMVHEKAPLLPAILLVGPEGVGKKMLVHAICNETGATLFDLSPLNIAGKYQGKGGVAMLLHMVFKVAKLLQPSVIWIGETEKMFYKKVPKEEKELDPKRLKKDLPKFLKLIKGEDRVILLGTTKDPLSADKSMCKMYSKIILIPRPDYGSRYILWKHLTQKQGGVLSRSLDLMALANISEGYTQNHIVQVIQKVITKLRILQLPRRPLTAAEFVDPLADLDPVFREDDALKTWYVKIFAGKKHTKEEDAAKKKGKGKK